MTVPILEEFVVKNEVEYKYNHCMCICMHACMCISMYKIKQSMSYSKVETLKKGEVGSQMGCHRLNYFIGYP